MNSNGGSLDFDSFINTTGFKTGADYMERRLFGLTKTAITESQKVDDTFQKLGAAAAGAFAFTELASLPKKLIDVRGEFQNLETAFKTMLGSKEKSDRLFQDVVKFAATTPFDLKGVASASKMLLAYGFDADSVTSTLTRLGDISAGLSIPLGELTELYGKAKVEGRVMAEDLNSFVGRGIPLIKLFADQWGVAESEVRGFVEQGRAGFKDVEQAIVKLTDSGGTFSGLMAEQSKGLLGLYSNFEDTITQAFNNIGKEQQGLLADGIRFATVAVENYEPIIDALKVIVAGYGTYRAAIIATAAVQATTARGGAVIAWLQLASGIRSAKDAQIAFNLATSKNPYVLAATALITLVTAVALFSDETNEATKAQERALSITERLNGVHAEEISKVQILTKQIGEESRSRADRNKSLQELIAISPKHFKALNIDTIATEKGAAAIRDYTLALDQKLKMQAKEEQVKDLNKRIGDIETGVVDDEFAPNMGRKALLLLESKSLEVYNKKVESLIQNQRNKAVSELKAQKDAMINEVVSGTKALEKVTTEKKTIDFYNKKIKDLEDKKDKESTTRTEAAAYEKQIAELIKQRNAISGQVSPGQKKAAKAAAAEEKEIRVKSFAEELEDKKRLYEVYQRFIDNFGKEAANAQFSELISKNKNYVAYLDQEISRLNAVKDAGYAGKLSDQDATDLNSLLAQRVEATGGKTVVQQFTEDLEAAKSEAKTLAEYLDFLYAKKSGIKNNGGANAAANQALLTSEIIGTEKQLKGMVNDFLNETSSYAQKRVQIEQKYVAYRKGAVLKYSKEELKTELDNIEKRREAEIQALADEELEKSESYQRLGEEIRTLNKDQLKQRIAGIEEDLKKEEISIKKKAVLEKALAATRKALNNQNLEGFKIAGAVISQYLGDVNLEFSKNFKLNLRDLGTAIEGAAKLASFDFSGASSGDKVAAVGDIIGIHNFLITSVRDAFKTASDFYTGMEGQDSYFQQLQNQIEGVNILLERQQTLLGNMTESEKSGGMLSMINAYGKAQEDALQGLKDLSLDVIKSADKVFVDPILGTEIKAKGFWGVYTQLTTAGKAETKIKYKFENIDTSGFSDIQDYINLLAQIKTNGGTIGGKEVVAADLQALETLIKSYTEAEEKQKQLFDEFKQFMTATTEANIADMIVSGLQAGRPGAEAFAQDFETMMRNAVVNSLKAQIMDNQLSAYYKKFSDFAMSDGILSKDEQKELKGDWDGIINSSKALYDQMEAITGIKLSESAALGRKDPLAGAINGMSQETGSLIAGQLNATRIHAADTAISMRQSLLHLSNISANSNYLKRLEAVENLLIDVNRNLFKGFRL